MIKKPIWTDRVFSTSLAVELLPNIIERLRGTPSRLEEMVGSLSSKQMIYSEEESWSIQQNVGHLADVEPLWLGRMDDFRNKLAQLRPADMSNAKTESARHNDGSLVDILTEFRRGRMKFVERLESLTGDEAGQQASHPRLEVTMRPVDLALFTAEHDDHHLARISEIKKKLQ